jgi:hypothetical protein
MPYSKNLYPKLFFMSRLLLLVTLYASINASAQQYKKFLFAFDLGVPMSNLSPIGSFTLEPGYRINDKSLIGFRMEQIGIVSMAGGNSHSLGSMGINYQRYLSLSTGRFFYGGGIGLYNPSDNFIMSNTDRLNQRNGFGFYPRIGWELGHLRLMVEYNFIQKMSDYLTSYALGAISRYELVDKSYLGLKIGFFIGGGKK